MGELHVDAKDALRRRIRAARQRLAPELVDRLGAEVCARVRELTAFRSARHVVAYAAVENEVDPTPVVEAAIAARKQIYYPRWCNGRLDFLSCVPANLRPGHAGIPEPPDGDGLPSTAPGVLILVPGVAFDPRGGRLGRGAGCYDRTLTSHAGAVPIGLAYEMQLVAALPEAPWDVRMAAVVTEARVLMAKEMQP